MILFVVHHYYPQISGCGVHVQWMAEALQAKGYDCWVCAARARGEPRGVNGIPIITERRLAKYFDVVFTYSSLLLQASVAQRLCRWKDRPRWLHYPCAQSNPQMLKGCDRVIAMNPKDVAVTRAACGGTEKVRRVTVGVHDSRIGRPGEFRSKYGIRCDYLLWVGAWLPAKGVLNLCRRFMAFRDSHPDRKLKLVMFGGYGDRERPIADKDIVAIDGNSEDVPSALRDCLCVVFNSPPAPVGFDANPLILVEALMNGKTFVAQAGTSSLDEIGHLGFVVTDDAEWQQAIQTIMYDEARRKEMEAACFRAYREKYNMRTMMAEFEAVTEH
jgi:glycosyltransferase involved in cell wall biosynthesis